MAVIPCTTTPPTLGIVTFDPVAFVAVYPEFGGFVVAGASPQLSNAFGLATLVLNNTCCSRVRDAYQRQTLLWLLTAHIAFLSYGTNDGAGNVQPPPGIVGRINTATEGSVSVGAEFGGNGGPTQDWYTSSKYGAQYWVATSQYRTAVYLGPPQSGPNGPGLGGWNYVVGGPGCGC
jgi:hypothetical protein